MSLLLSAHAYRLSRGRRPHRWRINCRMKGRRRSLVPSECRPMRAIGLLVLALLVVTACDAVPGSAPKGATGPTGDAAHAVSELLAPGTPVMDARFESFLV